MNGKSEPAWSSVTAVLQRGDRKGWVFIHWQNWKVAELVNLGEVITFSQKKMRLYTFSNFAGKRMFEILQATFRVAYPIYLMRCF